MRWQSGTTAPRDRPILMAMDACRSVGIWRDEWRGYVVCADGFDARDHHGEIIVVEKPDFWCEIPDVELET